MHTGVEFLLPEVGPRSPGERRIGVSQASFESYTVGPYMPVVVCSFWAHAGPRRGVGSPSIVLAPRPAPSS